MDKYTPIVSIITPLYNAEKYIERTIKSVIDQTNSKWELIIVDDGSSDDSLSIAQRYEGDKIHVYEQCNQGACVARNKGIEFAKGKYIKFLDADDVLQLDCLEKQLEQIENLQDNQIPFGDYEIIDESDNQIYNYKFDLNEELTKDQVKFFFSHWEVLTSSPLHRKEHIFMINGFDEKLRRCQETDLHFRLALSGVQFKYYPTLTYSYRRYNFPNSNISSQKEMHLQEYRSYIFKKNEMLFKQHYGCIPKLYLSNFVEFYFSNARNCYNNKLKVEGDNYLNRSRSYSEVTLFQKFYYWLGFFIGYCNLEQIFQWRLKILNKK